MKQILFALAVIPHLFLRTVAASPKADVLFILDNSPSTSTSGELYKSIGQNLQGFFSQFDKQGVDWKFEARELGGKLLHPGVAIDSDHFEARAGAIEAQKAIAGMASNGDASEPIFDLLFDLLDPTKKGDEVFRKDSKAIVILLTDSPAHGSATVNGVLTRLARSAGTFENVTVHGLFNTKGFGCQTGIQGVEENWAYAESRYRVLIEATGGLARRACGDMGRTFAEIATH